MTKRGARRGGYNSAADGRRNSNSTSVPNGTTSSHSDQNKQVNGERKPTFKEATMGQHRSNKVHSKPPPDASTNVDESTVVQTNGAQTQNEKKRQVNGHQNAQHAVQAPQAQNIVQPLPTTSTSTQTDAQHDALITFANQATIDKIDSICELVSILGPLELRLVGHCVEAAGRASNALLKQHETRANSSTPCAFFPTWENQSPQQMTPPFIELLHSIYMNVCLLASSNRLSGHQIASYIDEIVCKRWAHHLEHLPTNQLKLQAADLMGQITTACVHHPAFNVEQRIHFDAMRKKFIEEFRQMFEAMPENVKKVDEKKEQKSRSTLATKHSSPTAPASSMVFVFIKKFTGHPIPKDPERFSIEITWSDGERTFTQRTRQQLHELQHKLLDKFGGERKDADYGKKKETDNNKRNDRGESSSARRIIPYLSVDAPDHLIVQYINELSDLPARMMMSSIMFHEFHEERIATKGNSDEARSPNHQPPMIYNDIARERLEWQRRQMSASATNINTMAPLPVVTNPLNYAPAGMQHMLQIMEPTCSACAGNHPLQFCEKASNLDRPGDYRLDYSDATTFTDGGAVNANTTAQIVSSQGPPTSQSSLVNGHVPPSQQQHQMNGVGQMMPIQQMPVHPGSGQYAPYLASASASNGHVPVSQNGQTGPYRRIPHIPVHMSLNMNPLDANGVQQQPTYPYPSVGRQQW